jgi:hypothetical protein
MEQGDLLYLIGARRFARHPLPEGGIHLSRDIASPQSHTASA